jgi:ADP-ribosylglycohydrolase
MILSIVGDILGSSIEFNSVKPKLEVIDLERLARIGQITDDSVMTLATWQWWMDYKAGEAQVEDYIDYLREFFMLTPTIGYGPMFFKLMAKGELPNPPSCGNGATMRIIPLGLSADYPMEEMMKLVEELTLQTHKHPEAIKGAQATVYAMKRLHEDCSVSKEAVLNEIETKFGYDLHLNYEELLTRPFDATCQGSIPQALWCALSSDSADEMFKKALTIGGDSDTIACVAGGIFQAGMVNGRGDDGNGSLSFLQLAESKIANTGEIRLQMTHKASLSDGQSCFVGVFEDF